eukprot:1661671-Amphidinium_carterae.1
MRPQACLFGSCQNRTNIAGNQLVTEVLQRAEFTCGTQHAAPPVEHRCELLPELLLLHLATRLYQTRYKLTRQRNRVRSRNC